ncbi:hypothetical protein JCM19000A_18040 [Silvimonas sp. JCM 19000]
MSEHNAARIVQDVAKVWLALLGLLALTVGTALLPLGIWNTLLNALIALLKVVLIGLCYMELLRHDALPRLMAVVALFFLVIMLGQTISEHLTRGISTTPWTPPAQRAPLPQGGPDATTPSNHRLPAPG